METAQLDAERERRVRQLAFDPHVVARTGLTCEDVRALLGELDRLRGKLGRVTDLSLALERRMVGADDSAHLELAWVIGQLDDINPLRG